MSMKVSTRQVDGVTIVDCSGRITLGEGSVVLRETVRDLLSKGQKKILLNLGDVNYIDSSGIGELVSAFTTAKNQGGESMGVNQGGKGNLKVEQPIEVIGIVPHMHLVGRQMTLTATPPKAPVLRWRPALLTYWISGRL